MIFFRKPSDTKSRQYITGALAEGAIIESGENANGRYTKFADGTMICTRELSLFGMVIAPTDNPGRVWTFPAAFISNPCVVANGSGYAMTRCVIAFDVTSANASVYLYSVDGTTYTLNVTNTTPLAFLIAIGRWKA